MKIHFYGSGMANIEEIVIDEIEKMCSILSGEAGQPIFIQERLGTYIFYSFWKKSNAQSFTSFEKFNFMTGFLTAEKS